MLGLGILVGLGRRLMAGPVVASGLLPAGYYRHLVLTALEDEDFPRALGHLRWAGDSVLTQLLILRLRLLKTGHLKQRGALTQLLQGELPLAQIDKVRALLREQDRALVSLEEYERKALSLLGGEPGT